jgi:hypothetical protein
MDTVIVIYFPTIIILVFLIMFLYIFFYNKYTGDIIDLLKIYGFYELSNKINQLISTGGKMPFKGSLEARPLGKAWKEFIQLKISKDSGKLYKLQYFYKILRLTFIITGVLFSIPHIFLVIFICWKFFQ